MLSKQTNRLSHMEELVEGIKHAESQGWFIVRQTLMFRLRNICLEYCYDYDIAELPEIDAYFRLTGQPAAPIGLPPTGDEGRRFDEG